MGDISLSKAVRSNLLSLQNTSSMMAKTQERLSTGNKVNSALDNPSNFFTASGLNSRAGDLNSLMDSMANGIQTLEAADNGLTAITKTLESMQSTLRQARQDKSFETASYSLSNLDPNSGATSKMAFSGGAFGGTTDLALTTVGKGQTAAGSAAYAVPAAAPASYTGAANLTTGGNTAGTLNITYGGTTVSINVGANAASATSAADLRTDITNKLAGTALEGKITLGGTTGATLTAVGNEDAAITVSGTAATSVFGAAAAVRGSNGKLDVTVNGAAISLDSTTGASLTTAVTNANKALKTADSKFQAYDDGGKLAFRAITTDAGPLSIGGADASLFAAPAENASLNLALSVDELVGKVNNSTTFNTQIKASNDNGKLRIQNLSTRDLSIGGTNDSNQIIGEQTAATSIKGNAVRADLANQFNELRDQLDKLADDASFNGINLLRGDKLTITFNETGTSSIDIQTKGEKAISSASLGVSTTLDKADLDSDDNIDGEMAKLKSALGNVRSQSSSFGSNLSIVENRQNFTKSMINTLETGAANLTLADMNEEAANLLALQTRQSLSSNSLSLASQADQSVLQLIR